VNVALRTPYLVTSAIAAPYARMDQGRASSTMLKGVCDVRGGRQEEHAHVVRRPAVPAGVSHAPREGIGLA
jgi:hypothetical protein